MLLPDGSDASYYKALSILQVDVIHIKKPFVLFHWMGMNALIVYVLAACELFPTLIQGFYWRSPENNLVNVSCVAKSVLFSHLHQYFVHTKIKVLNIIQETSPCLSGGCY